MKEKRLISFSPSDLKWLKSQAGKFEISVTELVRRLVHAERERIKIRDEAQRAAR